jgi:hypothetical protein
MNSRGGAWDRTRRGWVWDIYDEGVGGTKDKTGVGGRTDCLVTIFISLCLVFFVTRRAWAISGPLGRRNVLLQTISQGKHGRWVLDFWERAARPALPCKDS